LTTVTPTMAIASVTAVDLVLAHAWTIASKTPRTIERYAIRAKRSTNRLSL
jgi:hypothetical protein